MLGMLTREHKLRGGPARFAATDEALRTARFVRQKGPHRPRMDWYGTATDSLKVLSCRRARRQQAAVRAQATLSPLCAVVTHPLERPGPVRLVRRADGHYTRPCGQDEPRVPHSTS